MIETINKSEFLSPQEVLRANMNVLDLASYWEQRKSDWPLFTLGKSLYRDASEMGFSKYTEVSNTYNSVLNSQLHWLYKNLKIRLEKILQAKVIYHDKLALPGFHIMLADERFTTNFADIHIDTQYQQIEFESISCGKPEEFSEGSVLSLTIPLEAPKSGAALNYWKVTKAMADELPREKTTALLRYENANRLEYEIGNIYLHSGLEFHQIAPWLEAVEGERRITLQAHGIKNTDGWLLFW